MTTFDVGYFDDDPNQPGPQNHGPGYWGFTALNALDGNEFDLGDTVGFSDSPSAMAYDISAGPGGWFSRYDFLRTYCMWQSSRDLSIPVSVARVNWQWGFTATAVQLPAGNWDWSRDVGLTNVSASVDDDYYAVPSWVAKKPNTFTPWNFLY
jgi:hypothetical protein